MALPKNKLEAKAKALNAAHPLKSRCVYYPIRRDDGSLEGEQLETVTASEFWVMGGHSVVVKIAGKSGGVSADHLVFPE